MSDSQALLDRAAHLVEAAQKAGATSADSVAVRRHSKSVSVRDGKLESSDASESDDVSLRVFVGQRQATVSAASHANAQELASRAVSMAKASPPDPFTGLADQKYLAQRIDDLDLLDETEISTDQLTQDALAAEAAAMDVEGVSKPLGAGASTGRGGMVLVTSGGFSGAYQSSSFGHSASVIAGQGTEMERDYAFSSRLHHGDLESPESVGRKAGERAVRRLGAIKAETGPVTAVFDPRVARSIAGHLSSLVNGAAIARKTSVLRDQMGQQILPESITVTDAPYLKRRPGSRPFDGDGCFARALKIIDQGVLRHWLLSTQTARELEIEPNGRSSRGGTPTSYNFAIEPGEQSPQDLIGSVNKGFYITELIGHGVNLVTGEYSRGASGFLIENGEITTPVSEVTIASNLLDMFRNLVAANDVDRNFATTAPTLLVDGMMLAGA